MISGVFQFIGRSGPAVAIMGAIFLMALAMIFGVGLVPIIPFAVLLVAVGIGLSLLWAFVFMIRALAR